MEECHAEAAAQEQALQQARDEVCRALAVQRQQLEEAHDTDRALLLREVRDAVAEEGTWDE